MHVSARQQRTPEVAGAAFPSLHEAMPAMSKLGPLTRATAPEMARFHSAKRRVHQLMRQLDLDSGGAMAIDGGPRQAAGSE